MQTGCFDGDIRRLPQDVDIVEVEAKNCLILKVVPVGEFFSCIHVCSTTKTVTDGIPFVVAIDQVEGAGDTQNVCSQ